MRYHTTSTTRLGFSLVGSAGLSEGFPLDIPHLQPGYNGQFCLAAMQTHPNYPQATSEVLID